MTSPAFDRALAAEPQLVAVALLVDRLCEQARPGDDERYGVVWEDVVKALVSPLVGDERGFIPRQAPDGPQPKVISVAEFVFDGPDRVEPRTETEKWLRTSEAFDAVMNELRSRLAGAESSGE